jgi:peptide/nickel transport system permease protein
MVSYIMKRILWMIPVALGITIIIFTIMYFTPGDPATVMLGSDATQAQIDQLHEELGLNQPYLVRLAKYTGDVFLHFDLGNSYLRKASVFQELSERIPRTIGLGLMCMLLQVVVGVSLGMIAAYNRNRAGDHISMFVALCGISIPEFWLALLMIMLFAVKLHWLPSFGIGGLKYYILPCISNAFGGIATQSRQTRSSMLEVISSDYITTARAKGLSESAIRFKHALPNSLITLITIIGTGFGHILGGTLVIETVFAIPGVGTYLINGVNNRDYPVVMGSVLLLGLYFSLIMLVVDIAYAFVDPRIKAQYAGKKRWKKYVK